MIEHDHEEDERDYNELHDKYMNLQKEHVKKEENYNDLIDKHVNLQEEQNKNQDMYNNLHQMCLKLQKTHKVFFFVLQRITSEIKPTTFFYFFFTKILQNTSEPTPWKPIPWKLTTFCFCDTICNDIVSFCDISSKYI